jgi:hypothetical protein
MYATVVNVSNAPVILQSGDGDSVQLPVGAQEVLIDIKFLEYQIPDITKVRVLAPDKYNLTKVQEPAPPPVKEAPKEEPKNEKQTPKQGE